MDARVTDDRDRKHIGDLVGLCLFRRWTDCPVATAANRAGSDIRYLYGARACHNTSTSMETGGYRQLFYLVVADSPRLRYSIYGGNMAGMAGVATDTNCMK